MKSPNTALMKFAEWMKDIPKDTLLDIQSTPTAIIFRKSTPIESPEEKCQCQEMTCPTGCKNNHTHKTFFCDKCEPEAVKKMYGKDEKCLEAPECKGTCEEEKGGWEERVREILLEVAEPKEWAHKNRGGKIFEILRSELATAREEERAEMLRRVESAIGKTEPIIEWEKGYIDALTAVREILSAEIKK